MKQKNELSSPLPRMMRTAILIGTLGCIAFSVLYCQSGMRWTYTAAITCGMLAYHMGIRFLSPVLLIAAFHRSYDPNGRWFRQRVWEPRLYRLLRVKNWKRYVIAYNPGEFSLSLHTPAEIVSNMCHAEAVHTLIVFLSFTSLLFAIPFGTFSAFLITAICAAAVDLSLVIVQRYNRPRMQRLAESTRMQEMLSAAGKAK